MYSAANPFPFSTSHFHSSSTSVIYYSSFYGFCLSLRELLRRSMVSSTQVTLKNIGLFLKIENQTSQVDPLPHTSSEEFKFNHQIEKCQILQKYVRECLHFTSTQLFLLKTKTHGIAISGGTTVFDKLTSRASPEVELVLVKMLFEKRDLGHLL